MKETRIFAHTASAAPSGGLFGTTAATPAATTTAGTNFRSAYRNSVWRFSLKKDIEILAAAEYYVDFDFEAKISKDKFLTFGENYILIELSFAEPPPNLYDIIFKLQLEKYKVILEQF